LEADDFWVAAAEDVPTARSTVRDLGGGADWATRSFAGQFGEPLDLDKLLAAVARHWTPVPAD
jgi:hypothetical protein